MRASAIGFSLQLALLAVLGRSAMAGGSALDLVDPPAGKGRFELRIAEANLEASGYWWKRGRESVHTSFAIDAAAVDAAIGSLLSDQQRFEAIDRRFVLLAREHYTGNEYQVSLRDLLALAGVVPRISESLLALLTASAACRDAYTRAEERLDAAVEKLEPGFVRAGASEEWRIPLERLGPEIEALNDSLGGDCRSGEFGEFTLQGRGLRFERRVDSGRRRLSIFETRAGEQAEVRPVAELSVWEDTTVPPPPAKPSPARIADPVAIFRLKIDQCHGQLPWEYSDFAAMHSWIPPSSGEYVGPTPLSGRYSCEEEAFASVETWGPADAGRARAEKVFASLREAARKSKPSAGPLTTFGNLLDGVQMQEEACLRLDLFANPNLVIGPRRYVWEATREENVAPGSLEPASPSPRSSFAHVSFPKDLMRQFDAIATAVADQGFRKRDDRSLPGLRNVGLESVETPARPAFGFQLSLTAEETSAGSVRVRYRFGLQTPCLVAPAAPTPKPAT